MVDVEVRPRGPRIEATQSCPVRKLPVYLGCLRTGHEAQRGMWQVKQVS